MPRQCRDSATRVPRQFGHGAIGIRMYDQLIDMMNISIITITIYTTFLGRNTKIRETEKS